MAIGCEDVSARMMELLYGELGGEDRAAVEAHLAGCVSCRAELAAFQGTRAAARRALDADAPPARVHDAILRAAAAAVAAKKPQPIEARPAIARPTRWERLRGRWTLPTFATVGAVAVVVLASKVFLEPEKTVELGRQTVAPSAKEAPRAQTIPEPEPAASAPAAAAADTELAKEAADREKSSRRRVSKRAVASQAPAKAAPRPAAKAAADQSIDDLLGAEFGSGKGGGGTSRRHQKISDDALDGLTDGASSDKSFREAPATKPGKREFAPPPPPRAQPAPAPAAPTSAPRAMEEDDVMEESPRRRAGAPSGAAGPPPAAHASPPPKKKAVEKDEIESADEEEEDNAPAPSRAAAAEKRKAPAKNDKPAVESPVAQADRLFAEGRWAEAARAYRELLRNDPRSADAGRWKQRLAAAEAEIVPPAHTASKKAAAPP